MSKIGKRAGALLFLLVLLVALACILVGVLHHQPLQVLARAATVCLECIGLG